MNSLPAWGWMDVSQIFLGPGVCNSNRRRKFCWGSSNRLLRRPRDGIRDGMVLTPFENPSKPSPPGLARFVAAWYGKTCRAFPPRRCGRMFFRKSVDGSVTETPVLLWDSHAGDTKFMHLRRGWHGMHRDIHGLRNRPASIACEGATVNVKAIGSDAIHPVLDSIHIGCVLNMKVSIPKIAVASYLSFPLARVHGPLLNKEQERHTINMSTRDW
jgi:hypothetical protein